MKHNLKFTFLLAACFSFSAASAQNGTGGKAYSLQEAVNYGIENRPQTENARLEVEAAKGRIGEIRAIGLPQISASADVGDNFIQQRSFIPGAFVGQEGFIPVTFTPKWVGNAGLNGSQLLFDGSYLIGLKAAQTYAQLSKKAVKQTEIEVAEGVTKAYYSVLVSEANIELLQRSVQRIDTVLMQTRAINEAGFAERIDVTRLEVQYNNAMAQLQTLQRVRDLSNALLRFQMGLPDNQPIALSTRLNEVVITNPADIPSRVNYSDRIEYSQLQTQKELAQLDLRNIRAGYYPRLLLNSRFGYNAANDDLSGLGKFGTNWFSYGYVGLSLQVPVFDGLNKHYRSQQAKVRLRQTDTGFRALEQGMDLELSQARTNLENAIATLETHKRNMQLAKEVVRVSQIKYREGVGSSLEVITAENDLTMAESNYSRALYDLVITQVDLQKALGKLY